MKKILLPILLLLAGFSAQAQWSAMTIRNHSTSCDYNVRLYATYDFLTACNYENQTICVPAGAVLTATSYWEWACFNPFVTGPAVPDAPSTQGGAPCGGVGTTAAPFGTPTGFDWRGALIWPCGTLPVPPGNNTAHPCGTTHAVGDGFCGASAPTPPI